MCVNVIDIDTFNDTVTAESFDFDDKCLIHLFYWKKRYVHQTVDDIRFIWNGGKSSSCKHVEEQVVKQKHLNENHKIFINWF